MKTELNQEQQNLLVLELVKVCIEYAKDEQKSFEEVLNEDVFPNQADTEFAEMVCRTLESLNRQGYISGTVELEYEIETDLETDEDTATNAIDFAQCTFENIGITAKGSAYMSSDSFKKAEVGKDFLEKAKAVIKCIATTALQTLVETAVVLGLKAAGITV